MTRITTNGQAKRYVLYSGGNPAIAGVLAGTDYMATSLTPVIDADENSFINSLTPSDFPDLPEQGTELEKDDIYNWQGQAVIVRQSHTRTEHDPSDVPALFLWYQPDIDGIDWIVGESVSIGQQRMYDGTLYQCRQSHVTQADWTPDVTPALWSVVPEPSGEWQTGYAYNIGDVVIYDGNEYECIQAHTSQADWTPDTTPTLWSLVSTTDEWQAGVAYTGDNTAGAGNGDIVIYDGSEYRCLQSHTSQVGWEPPNVPALWVLL